MPPRPREDLFPASDSISDCDVVYLRNQARIGIVIRTAGHQAIHVRQQNQQIRSEAAHHERAQLVIIAETRVAVGHFQFFSGHGVVFIDDRNHFHVQQRHQGVLQIAEARGVGEVLRGQQHLRRDETVLRESLLVQIHQPALADCGKGLLLDQQVALLLMQRVSAQRNRAGRDDENLPAGVTSVREIFNQFGDAVERESAFAVEEEIGAQFDNNARSVSNSLRIVRFRPSSSSPGCAAVP